VLLRRDAHTVFVFFESVNRHETQRAGVTEQELATKIAISEEQLNDFCLGNQRVSPPVLIEISRALNQGTAWFFQPDNDLD
jgi:plasmid maintenance system antidote protein VapI